MDLQALTNNLVEKNNQYRVDIDVPDWDAYFLGMAMLVAARSKDGQTKNGAVLTDSDHRIIATGYNGFVAGTNDRVWPNLRPNKYPYILHAEKNCLLNMGRPINRKEGATMYLTMAPCFPCLMDMVQAGVNNIIAIDTPRQPSWDAFQDEFDYIIQSRGIYYSLRKPNLDFVKEIFK